MWRNPAYCKHAKANIRKALFVPHYRFPKSNPLHKIFNRSTLKLSYSYMSNIKTTRTTIRFKSAYDQNLPKKEKVTATAETSIPVPWTETATEATLFVKQRSPHHNLEIETNIGLCATTFKLRYRNHMCSSEAKDTKTHLN